jgi:hypothetical protein
MRVVTMGAWAYRRWRLVIAGLNVAAIALFGLIAAIAAAALPGGFAAFFLGVGVLGGLFLLLRLPPTLRLARRRPAARTVPQTYATPRLDPPFPDEQRRAERG